MKTKTKPRTRGGNAIGNVDAIVDYWIERLQTPMNELFKLGRESDWLDNGSMSFRDDDLRHYGHWTLATAIRDTNGRVRFVLVNGDRYIGSTGWGGVSTTQRTAHAESAARQAGFEVLNVPFSALQAAGIEMDSIRILEALRESYAVTLERVSAREVIASLERDYSPYRGEPNGTISVRDDRHSYAEDVRWTLEPDGDSFLVPRFRHWLGEALFSARVRGRNARAKFLSAFDHNENWCYFLCELPRCNARTVDEAFEALKPAEVARAIDAGLAVERQGDIFAIPTSLTTRELKLRAKIQTITRYEQTGVEIITQGRRFNREIGDYEVVALDEPYEHAIWDHVEYQVPALRMRPLLGTNHVATEQITTLDGDTYARGMLRHRPERRDPDHRMIKLGDGRSWYRILKNTVPLATTRRRNTGVFGPQQSGQSRAWTLGGQVD